MKHYFADRKIDTVFKLLCLSSEDLDKLGFCRTDRKIFEDKVTELKSTILASKNVINIQEEEVSDKL